MAEKRVTGLVISYSDGSYEYAGGDHAAEVMDWFMNASALMSIHGGNYSGRKLIAVPAQPVFSGLEAVESIAARVFPNEVEEIRNGIESVKSREG